MPCTWLAGSVGAGVRAGALLLCLAAPRAVGAQDPAIEFGLRAAGAELRPGGTLLLTLVARIPRGWHLYGMRQPADGPVPTTIEVGPAPLFTLAAPVTGSPPRTEFDPNFGLALEWHDDSALFRVPLRAARTALPGPYDAQVRISYQRCNDRVCLPLTTDTLVAPLSVEGAPEPLPAPPGAPQATSAADSPAPARAPAAEAPLATPQAESVASPPSGQTGTLAPPSGPQPDALLRGDGDRPVVAIVAGALALLLAGLILVARRRRPPPG